jgi:GH15 family glucan-1,4-alpha-glucosidase
MARRIVLSNGELHVGLNDFGAVHDFYYPYVGFENHSAVSNTRHRIGVWVDGQISWLDDPNNNQRDWNFTFRYPHGALVGYTMAQNDRIGIILEFDDFVDSDVNAFFRNIHIVNTRADEREVRLFMHQAFVIGDSNSNTDTAQYIPHSEAILHYRGRRAFVVSGECDGNAFDQHTIGLFGIEGKQGTFRDAEDGELSCNDVEHGRVDSTIRFKMNIAGNSSQRAHYWIAAGTTTREALNIHKTIQDDKAMSNLKRTSDWWHRWLQPTYSVIDKIEQSHRSMFLQSVMIIKSQIDIRGGIIASTDTSMLNYSRDAYAYCWPRDGAYAIWPLMRIGYKEEALRFFQFTRRGMHPDGYMMHKYRADGAMGSSWHSYVHEGGIIAPPIQEDETAMPVFMFAQYYHMYQDSALLKDYYESMIVPMANFLAGYIDEELGLPKPSYDLWEETFITSTYTTSVVYAALISAADLAQASDDQDNAVKWRTVADDIKTSARKYFFNDERHAFRRGVINVNGQVRYDDRIDCSSTFGAYIFGLFDGQSQELKQSVATIEDLFGIKNGAKGLPRYENDYYHRQSAGITGNLWYITSLWLAQYYIDTVRLEDAVKIVDWVKSAAYSTGVLSEQFDPVTNQPISPAPLTWSHAEYIATLLDIASIKD